MGCFMAGDKSEFERWAGDAPHSLTSAQLENFALMAVMDYFGRLKSEGYRIVKLDETEQGFYDSQGSGEYKITEEL